MHCAPLQGDNYLMKEGFLTENKNNTERINDFYSSLISCKMGNTGNIAYMALRPLGDFIAHIESIDITPLSDKELFSFLVFCDNFYKVFPAENYAVYRHYRFHVLGEVSGSSYTIPKVENINDENSIANLFVEFFKVFGFDEKSDNSVCNAYKDREFLFHFLNLVIDSKKIFAVPRSFSDSKIDYTQKAHERKKSAIVYSPDIPAERVFYEETVLRFLNFLIEHFSLEQENMRERGLGDNIFSSDRFNPVIIELYANTYGLVEGTHFKDKSSYLAREERTLEETFVLSKFSTIANALNTLANSATLSV